MGKCNNCLVAGISNMVIKIVEYIAITNFGKGILEHQLNIRFSKFVEVVFLPILCYG